MSRQDAPFKVRLPSELMEWVRASAARHCRSMNGEIEFRLSKAREAEQAACRATGEAAGGEASRA